MNLKEAFQTQNKIESLFHHAMSYLRNTDNIITVTEKHFRSKAADGQSDETLDMTDYANKIYDTATVVDFIIFLIEEREKLSKAICAAKAEMDFDLDTAVDINKKRHLAAEVFREMRQLKSSGVLKKNFGTGYVFNKEGNQTTYRYDVEIVKTIDFDRNKIRVLLRKLQKKANKISNEIDLALINTAVKYKFPFDLHASAAEILEDFSKDSI